MITAMASNTVDKAKQIGGKVLQSDSFIATFLRSFVSSQTASWVDMGLGFVLFAWLNLMPWLSTAIGAFAGGVINCIINYRFTFHAQGCDWRAVIVKYALVWLGSATFNSLGTQVLYFYLEYWTWLETLGFRPDGYFAVARLTVSLIVSWFWNFLLQRYFVYRVSRFDPTAIRIVQFFSPKHLHNVSHE